MYLIPFVLFLVDFVPGGLMVLLLGRPSGGKPPRRRLPVPVLSAGRRRGEPPGGTLEGLRRQVLELGDLPLGFVGRWCCVDVFEGGGRGGRTCLLKGVPRKPRPHQERRERVRYTSRYQTTPIGTLGPNNSLSRYLRGGFRVCTTTYDEKRATRNNSNLMLNNKKVLNS